MHREWKKEGKSEITKKKIFVENKATLKKYTYNEINLNIQTKSSKSLHRLGTKPERDKQKTIKRDKFFFFLSSPIKLF